MLLNYVYISLLLWTTIGASKSHKQQVLSVNLDVKVRRRLHPNKHVELENRYAKHGTNQLRNTHSATNGAPPIQGVITSGYTDVYAGKIGIGTPAKMELVLFDTGSQECWALTKLSRRIAPTPPGRPLWDPRRSKTSRFISPNWTVQYIGFGDEGTGNAWTDNVKISRTTIPSVGIGAIYGIVDDPGPESSSFDGIIGLSNNPNQSFDRPTFQESIKEVVGSRVFATALGYKRPGALDFGFLNSSRYTGEILYTPNFDGKDTYPGTNYSPYWALQSKQYMVGGQSYSTTFEFIIDSGSTLVYVPEEIITNYYSQIPGALKFRLNSADMYHWPYDANFTLPDLSLSVSKADGSGFFTITTPGENLIWYLTEDDSVPHAVGALAYNLFFGIYILGDYFLAEKYVVFDGENGRLGFARRAD